MTVGPPVSVVIPAFQAERYIGGAIESVVGQDVPPAELIVVDDGSSDGTEHVVSRFGDRVRLIRQPNGGEAAARNTGLDAAAHDWVMFLDADDEYLPGRLRAVTTAMSADDAPDVITTDAELRSGGVTVRRCYDPDWTFAHSDQRTEILRRNFVFGHVAVRRGVLAALGGFDTTIAHAADWDMWIRVLLAGGRIGLVPEVLSLYRLHARSMSADRVGIELGCVASLTKALANPLLTPTERPIAEASWREHGLLLDRARLAAGVAAGAGVRSAALVVARNRDHPVRTRVTALATAVAPGAAARVVRRRRRGFVIGTTGRLVPSDDETSISSAPPTTARNRADRDRSG